MILCTGTKREEKDLEKAKDWWSGKMFTFGPIKFNVLK
jgi:hypothetical protein